MKKNFWILPLILFVSVFLCSCNKKKSQTSEVASTTDSIRVYGIKSGYFRTIYPLSKTNIETWFDKYGALQYVEIREANDKYVSMKLVRGNDEYYFSTYNNEGIKKTVEYVDYRVWENPSQEEIAQLGIIKQPVEIIDGKACKVYFINAGLPAKMYIWNGFIMKNVTQDGDVLTEIIDFREVSVPLNRFDIPSNINFTEEVLEEPQQ
ncbi:MAG: hypothetical protein J6U44_04315 [Paludibacteraceae bacterium]|nr:hypothetical protein [Paludibacteraceae bacterium]